MARRRPLAIAEASENRELTEDIRGLPWDERADSEQRAKDSAAHKMLRALSTMMAQGVETESFSNFQKCKKLIMFFKS